MHNKMDLPIRMRFIYNVKYRYVIYLKFGDKFLTSLTKIVLELYVYELESTLYCHKFPIFVITVIINIFQYIRSVSQRNTAYNRN